MRKRIDATCRVGMPGIISVLGIAAFVTAPIITAPAAAQNRASRSGATVGGATPQFGANRQILRPTGVRLEGNAFIRRPELEVNADAIALDYSASSKSIQEVRARGKVFFRVNLPPRGGGPAALVEARCAAADLDPNTRTLVLTGNVDGFYQVAGGPKNLLSGDKVTLTFVEKRFTASSVGQVRVVVPAEAFGAGANGTTTAIGSVTITAGRADVDSASGLVTFAGNARAVSTDGPNKFDVAAPMFTLTRGANGTIDTLRSSGGRASVKIDLPPDPAAASATVAMSTNETRIGRPTRVEAEADSVTVTRATNTLVFVGKVKGFYRLQPANQAASDYRFHGDRTVIRYVVAAQATATVPAGFQVEVTGNPSAIEAPAFNLGF